LINITIGNGRTKQFVPSAKAVKKSACGCQHHLDNQSAIKRYGLQWGIEEELLFVEQIPVLLL
jgi:hypothetical protein